MTMVCVSVCVYEWDILLFENFTEGNIRIYKPLKLLLRLMIFPRAKIDSPSDFFGNYGKLELNLYCV